MVRCTAQDAVLGPVESLELQFSSNQLAVLTVQPFFQLQEAFADCAADIKSTFESQDARQTAPHWPASALHCIAVLFLRAGRTQDAW